MAFGQVRAGDVLGVQARDCVGRIIQACSLGWLNHLAIIAPAPTDHEFFGLLWYEASMSIDVPCVLTEQVVRGVQAHGIGSRVFYERERAATVWHFPLLKPLNEVEAEILGDHCYSMLGVPYDYWGAFQARVLGGRWLTRRLWPSTYDANMLFCNEFVGGALLRVDRFPHADPGRFNPSNMVRFLRDQEVLGEPRRLGKFYGNC